VADQVGEGEGQRQADQEAFAAGQRAGVAGDFALPTVDDVEFQFAAGLAAQQVAAAGNRVWPGSGPVVTSVWNALLKTRQAGLAARLIRQASRRSPYGQTALVGTLFFVTT
jgi:hypothetical protein